MNTIFKVDLLVRRMGFCLGDDILLKGGLLSVSFNQNQLQVDFHLLMAIFNEIVYLSY